MIFSLNGLNLTISISGIFNINGAITFDSSNYVEVGTGADSLTAPFMVYNANTTAYPVIAKFLAPYATGGTLQMPMISLGISNTEISTLSFIKYGSGNAQNSFAIGHSGVSQAQFVFTRNNCLGIDNINPYINLSVGGTNGNHYMGRSIINANSQHNADKRDAFSIGRVDGQTTANQFLGIKYVVCSGSSVGEPYDNQAYMSFYT